MSEEFKAALVRLARVGLVTGLVAVWSLAQEEPLLLGFVPIIASVGKYLRDKFGWSWLPF